MPVSHPPTPQRFYWISYGISLYLGGFGSIVALALAAPDNPLCHWWWDLLLVLGLLTGLSGLWLLSSVFLGKPPLPLSHEERQQLNAWRQEAAEREAAGD